MRRPQAWLLAALAAVIVGPADVPSAQARLSRLFQLDAFRVVGAARYSSADVVKLSGLTIGARVSAADLDRAARRMASTGLFSKVVFAYTTIGTQLTVTFTIEEARWTMPVTYDNFVWFSDSDIVTALRVMIPTFDGMAPETPGMPELLTRSLQALLAARQIAGRVEFRPQGTVGKGLDRYDFRVVDPSPSICELRFPGAAAIPEAQLAAALKAGGGSDYSRSYLTRASDGTLGDMYRRQGRWAVAIGPPRAAAATGCDGVAVTMAIDEGAVYSWSGVEWHGHRAMSVSELDQALGLEPGRTAELGPLRDGIRRVELAYERRGYITRGLTYVPRLEPAGHRLAVVVTVEEGPQFRMGTVEFLGATPALVDALSRRWRLAEGDVYDGTYARDFLSQEIVPRLPSGAHAPQLDIMLDAGAKRVAVRVRFAG